MTLFNRRRVLVASIVALALSASAGVAAAAPAPALLKDFSPNAPNCDPTVSDTCVGDGIPQNETTLGNKVLFGVGALGEIWSTKATAPTTTQVLNDAQVMSPMTVSGTTGYFWGRDEPGGLSTSSTTGTELWRTDGTAAGTHMVKDIKPGAGSSLPTLNHGEQSPIVALGNGKILFIADDGVHGGEVWSSDGTSAGTSLVQDVRAGSTAGFGTAEFLTTVGNYGFWWETDGTHGAELWRSDGTPGGATMVKDINPGAASGLPSSFDTTAMLNLNGKLLTAATDGVHGNELWISDGTADGTTMVKDIRDTNDATGAGSAPKNFARSGTTAYFSAGDATHGVELWRTDGTLAGTRMVKDFFSASPGVGVNPHSIVVANSKLWFAGTNGTSNDNELFVSSGSAGGTQLVKDINPGTTGSNPSNFTAVAGQVVFQAMDGTHGNELWQTDGTEANTFMVADMFSGAGPSNPHSFARLNGTVVFTATDVNHGEELWRYAPAQPKLVHDHYAFTDTDGDGLAEPGETIDLTEYLRNSGTADATNATAKLTSTTPGVSVSAANGTWDPIPVGAVQGNSAPLVLTIGSGVACGTPITLSLKATSNAVSWTVPVTIPSC